MIQINAHHCAWARLGLSGDSVSAESLGGRLVMSYLLAVLMVVALMATVASLFGGLLSMGIGGALDDRNSTRLMVARVSLQALAVGLILLLLFVLKH